MSAKRIKRDVSIGTVFFITLLLIFFASMSSLNAQDFSPPEITINFPIDSAVTNQYDVELNTSISDESAAVVKIYGGTDPLPTDLQYVEDVPYGNNTVSCNMSALVLKTETSTMGLWHFDSNTGTGIIDATSNGNDGTFAGSPQWTTAGRFGYGLELNGTTDYIDISDDPSLDIDSATGAMTIEVWIYPHSVGGGVWRTIMAKRDGSPANYQVTLDQSTGNLTFYSGHWPDIYTSSIYIPENEWSYIAISLDAVEGLVRFYRNGVQGDSISGGCFGPANSDILHIGSVGNTSQSFDGVIDEVRISDRVLSTAEIAANYTLDVGVYHWMVSAKDESDNEASSADIIFFIDTLAPSITLTNPDDGFISGHDYMELGLETSDQYPVTVSIYGDLVDASELLTSQRISGTDLLYNWTAPVLIPDINTAALYHFDGSAADASGNANDGVLYGGVSYDAGYGRFNGGYEFNGSDGYIEVDDDPSLDITGDITIQAWVYPTAMGSLIEHAVVAKRAWGGSDCNYEMYIEGRYGNLSWRADGDTVKSSVTFSFDEWQHMAITLNNSTGSLRFFRNGELEDERVGAIGAVNDEPLYIGVAEDTDRCFEGRIDDLKISNVVLTPAEIMANTRLGEGVYYWKAIASDGANETVSETRSFTIHYPPVIPELINPPDLNVSDNHTPTFEWSSTAGDGGYYTLEYAVDEDFTVDVVTITVLDDTIYIIPEEDSLVDNKYYWHVQAYDSFDESSGYQDDPFEFTLYTDMEAPEIVLHSPASGEFVNSLQYVTSIADTSSKTIFIYSDQNPDPTSLLYVNGFDAGTDTIIYFCDVPTLKLETMTKGLWHFDEGTGTTVSDQSGKSNNGIIYGDPVWTMDGRFGYAILFDGYDNRVSIADDPSLDIDSASGAITLEAWIYPHSVGGGTWRTILAKRDASPANYQLNLDQSTGNLTFYSGHWPDIYISSIYIPENEWSYIAVTLDATEGLVRFYRNGVQGDSISGACFGPANTATLQIGSVGNTSQSFDGIIDEVRISAEVLSPSEIMSNYQISSGEYYWKVRAIDKNGHESTSEIRLVNADLTAPMAEVISPPSGQSYGVDSLPIIIILFEDSVGLDRGYYQIDGCDQNWIELWSNNSGTSFNSYFQIPSNMHGEHSIYFKVVDDVGNVNLDSCDYTWSWTYIFFCGDANNDLAVNISDAVYIINYVFVGGDPPNPLNAGDVNCDGTCNVSDAVWIINYVFIGGNLPCDTDGDEVPDC